MSSPGTGRLAALATSPAAPAPGYLLLYFKTDGILYIKDSSNVETPIGTASGITSLTGEATASGPGAASVTLSNSAVIGKVLTGFTPGPNSPVLATDTILQAVQKLQSQVSSVAGTSLVGDVTGTLGATVVSFVGGESAADVAQSVTDTQTATPTNTASTIVKRDASGNFSANEITADLIGNADSATTAANVGGKTAAEISQSVDDTQDATSVNTASTIVKRDASGNFSANTITANLTGTASGNEPPIIATTSVDYYRGDKTFQPLNKAAVGLANVANLAPADLPVSTAQAAADAAVAAQATLDLNDHITDATDAHDASAVSFDPSGTGLVATEVQAAIAEVQDNVDTVNSNLVEVAQDAIGAMIINTDSIDLTYTDATPELKADLKLSTNSEDSGFVRIQNNIESTGVPGLRSQVEVDIPVQIGTSNFAGAANRLARADHVHSHGNQTNGSLHAAATTSVNGFMSAVDKTKLDASTSSNTPSTLVQRDSSGNFSAGTITADLSGNVTGNVTGNVSGSAASFTGSLVGDVTGTQGATVVDSVGGKTSSEISTSVDDTQAATSLNTASTIVKRDADGDFSMRDLTARRITQTGGYYSSVVSLTDGPTINTDASLGNIFTVTIAGNRTFVAPTNPTADQKITYKIRQDAVGGRIITWDSNFNFGVDLSGVPNSTAPDVFDYYGFQYNATTSRWDCLAISRGY